MVLSRGSGPISPIRPWGPTLTWMSCLAGPWGCSFMLALRETLSTYWTNQSSHGWSIVASKRLGQTCPHPMPYCTVRIVLLWDVRVVICALRCRQNFTTIVVSVEATTIVSNNVAVDLNNNWASYRYTKVNLKEMKMLISVKTAPKFCLLKLHFGTVLPFVYGFCPL